MPGIQDVDGNILIGDWSGESVGIDVGAAGKGVDGAIFFDRSTAHEGVAGTSRRQKRGRAELRSGEGNLESFAFGVKKNFKQGYFLLKVGYND